MEVTWIGLICRERHYVYNGKWLIFSLEPLLVILLCDDIQGCSGDEDPRSPNSWANESLMICLSSLEAHSVCPPQCRRRKAGNVLRWWVVFKSTAHTSPPQGIAHPPPCAVSCVFVCLVCVWKVLCTCVSVVDEHVVKWRERCNNNRWIGFSL